MEDTEKMNIDDFELLLKEASTDPACLELYQGMIVPCGFHLTTKKKSSSVVVNGLEYSREDEYPAVIDYESVEAGSAVMWYLEGEKVKKEEYPIYYKKIGFAPFFCIDAYYDETVLMPIEIEPCKCVTYFKDPLRNVIAGISKMHDLAIYHTNLHKLPPHKPNMALFSHTIQTWGYGNNLSIRYRYDDLLNMDASEQDKFDLSILWNECHSNSFMRDTLNFDVFERPLTDLEKLECTKRFLVKYSNEITK